MVHNRFLFGGWSPLNFSRHRAIVLQNLAALSTACPWDFMHYFSSFTFLFSTNSIVVTIFVTASDKYLKYDPVLLEFYIYFPVWVHTYITPENIFIGKICLPQIRCLFFVLVDRINERGNIRVWVSIFLITSFWILLDSQV